SALPHPTAAGTLLVEGPRGSGRATAAAELLAGRGTDHPPEQITPSPAVEWAEITELLDGGADVLLRRVEDLPDHEVAQLTKLAAEHRTATRLGRRTSTLLLTACRQAASEQVRGLLDEIEPAR